MNIIESKLCLHRSKDPSTVPFRNGFVRSVASLVLSAGLLAASALQATPVATLTTQHSFDPTNDGSLPVRGLLQHSDGNFYGCARNGGTYGHGTVFKVTPSGTFSVVYSFQGIADGDGGTPFATLLEGPDHLLYGICGDASIPADGNVFKLTTDGTLTVLYTFLESDPGIGGGPVGLAFGNDGNLYVTCAGGGTTFDGTIVQVSTDGSTVAKFAEFSGSNGNSPNSHLLLASDGNFYGTTYMGGSSNNGTVFQLTSDGTINSLVSFNGTSYGAPTGSLIQGSDGSLYGTTTHGNSGHGTIFKITTGGTLSLVANMTTGSGTQPNGALVQGPDNNFYGLSYAGGTFGLGTLFKVTPGGSLTALINFEGASDPQGANPIGDLIVGTDGLLHGTAYAGGANDAGTVFSADVGFNSLAPTIAVQSVPGTNLVSGTGYISFGNVGNGAGAIQTVIVKNTGTAALSLGTPSVTVSKFSSEFTVNTSGMSSSVAAGTQTTFTVELNPVTFGTRVATLVIPSNDATHPTFSLTLSASSVPPSAITFSAPTYVVDQGARTVNLVVNRAVTTQAQTVVINTADGTDNAFPPFTGATAGVDYTNLTGAATTVSFAAGQISKNVPVTLSPKTGTVPNMQFTATLSDPSLTATLGAITTTTVEILANDTTKPTVDVTNPDVSTTSLDAVSNPTVTVTGSADDARGISKVTVTANGVAYPAVLGSVSGTTVQFSLTFAPYLGSNTLSIAAYDLRGNVTSVPRNFTLTGGVSLSITRSVPSGISTRPDTAGIVTVAATPSHSVGPMLPVTANVNPKSCLVVPAAPVVLTAVAYSGYAFDGWSGLPSGATTVGNTASFNMPSDPTSVTANYIASPFGGATGKTTSFYGPLNVSGGGTPSINTEGFLTGTLNAATGAFSGVLSIDGASTTIIATFYGDGSSSFGTASTLAATFTTAGGRTLALSYNAGLGNDQISMTSVKGLVTSTGTAKRGYYSAARKVPSGSGLLNLSTSGVFTFVLPTQAQTPSKDTSTYPQGDGIGTITLTNTGIVTIAGTLADGMAFTTTSAMVDSQTCPFFVQLVTPANSTKLGAFGGTLVFDATQSDSDVLGTNLLWIRPAAAGSALYTAGWPNGVTINLVGSLYAGARTAQSTLGLAATDPTNGNARIVFADGNLPSTIPITLFNISGNAVSYVGSTSASLSLVIGTGGSFSGWFAPNWTSPSTVKPTYKGIMLQKGANQGGYGYFISNRVADAHPESGGVTLSAQ